MNRREFIIGSAGVAATMALPYTAQALGKDTSLWKRDALGLADLVRSKEVSALELLDATIDRCEQLNPKYNAIVLKHYDKARQDIAAGLPEGPFMGVPFALKDSNVELAGTVTANGSKHFRKMAKHDSELVARYRKAGLVMFAKTASPEGAAAGSTESHAFGLTLNPWNPERAVGGSSGGAAAAVASGMLPAAHATDGGGSLRSPASHCGLYGLKVSRGLTPHGGDLSVAHSITKTVRDSAALLDAIAGPYTGQMYRALMPAEGTYLQQIEKEPKKLKIAFFDTYEGFDVHKECRLATQNAARLCEQLGHHVEEIKAPVNMAKLTPTYLTMFKVGMLAATGMFEKMLGRSLKPGDIDISKVIAAEEGKKIDAISYMMAQKEISSLTKRMAYFFTNYDVLLTPTIGQPPVDPAEISPLTGPVDAVTKVAEAYGSTTLLGNLAGIPGASVPLHWTPEGLPVGVQFQSANGKDALVLQLSAQIEKAQPWIHKYPDFTKKV